MQREFVQGSFEAIDWYTGIGWFAKGWAFHRNQAPSSVILEVWSEDGPLLSFRADQPRSDLEQAGLGACAFEVALPSALLDGNPHMFRMRIASENRWLPQLPPKIFGRLRFRGRLDRAFGLLLKGWAIDDLGDSKAAIDVFADNALVGRTNCNRFRADLILALGADGYNGFEFALPATLCDGKPHGINVRFTNTDVDLPGSPFEVCLHEAVLSPRTRALHADLVAVDARLSERQATYTRETQCLLHDPQRYQRWLVGHERFLAQCRNRPLPPAVLPPLLSFVAEVPDGSSPAAVAARLPISQDEDGRWENGRWEVYLSGPNELPAPVPPGVRLLPGVRFPSLSLLEQTRGTFVILLPAGSHLHAALPALLEEAVTTATADVVYTDEDALDADGRRHSPFFKPDWDPDRHWSLPYVGPICCVRRDLLIEAARRHSDGGDVALLLDEVLVSTPPERIRHLPAVLVHREAGHRALARSTRERAAFLNAHFDRTGTPAEACPMGPVTRIRWKLPSDVPAVSIIVPTRDHPALLESCVTSLLERTRYPRFKLVLVDNGSTDPEALRLLDRLAQDPRVVLRRDDRPFNFAALCNAAVAAVDSPLIALVNNDVEVIEPDWLTEMAAHALRPEVGAVGAKLLYPDGGIQHGGVVIGLHGVADNAQRGFRGEDDGYFGSAQVTQNASAVTAACLVCRRSVYLEVGGMDAENLAVAFNDVDFCLNIRRRGLRVIWTPYALLRHYESASRDKVRSIETIRREEREATHLRTTWATDQFQDPFYNPNMTRSECSHMDFFWADET